jgi:hypothetical protein
MNHWKLAGTTAIAALLAGNAALAEITPEEVWQNWQDMSSSYGQAMTATSAVRDGDTLIVTGLNVAQDQDGMTVDLTIDEVNFTDNGDGTVEITMSDAYTVDLTMPAADGVEGETPTSLTIAVSQPDMVTTVSGTPEETAYEVDAPTITIKLDSIEGVDAAAVDAMVEATMTAVLGNYSVAGPANAKVIDVAFDAESIAIGVAAKDPESASDFQMTGTVADLGVSYMLDMGGLSLMGDNVAAALKAGTAIEGGFDRGLMDLAINVTEATGLTKITATSQSGSMAFAMDAAGLVYEITGEGTALTMSGPEIPFPEVKVNYGEIAATLSMPLLASPDITDFTFLTKIVDFSVSQDLWGMIDPGNILPHDPATVIIDTKGTVKLTSDLVDETAMAALGETAPGEIYSLDVTELRAKAAGAELTGSGAFTFDNTDLATFGGMPTPTGKLDLKLVGGNVLLDKLVAMGIMTDDDANGARMMISMFANPGASPEELTSTLEFKDKGFYANGQRLQ